MTSGTALPVGQSLKVPNTISNVHNTANTFKPYNPGEVIGSTAPDMPSPPPPPKPKKKKCGALAMVIIAAVAIVATVMTAGAAAAVMFGAAGGLTAGGALALGSAVMSGAFGMAFAGVAVASAAIGAAVGSMISQGLAVATGYQDKFSWKQVGQSALAGGITAGVGSIISGLSTLGSTTNAIISSSASTALTGAARGHFSWKSVVMSATSAAISSRVGEIGVKKWSGTSREFTNNYLGGVARQRIQIAVYGEGKMNYRDVAVDSFGNMLGNAAKEFIKTTEEKYLANRAIETALEKHNIDPNSEHGKKLVEMGQAMANKQVSADKIEQVLGDERIRDVAALGVSADRVLKDSTPLKQELAQNRAYAAEWGKSNGGQIPVGDGLASEPGTIFDTFDTIYVTASRVKEESALDTLMAPLRQGAEAISDFYFEHPVLASAAITAVEMAAGGPAKMLIRELAGDVAGSLTGQAVTAQFKDWGYSDQQAGLYGDVAAFGVELAFGGAASNVIHQAKIVSSTVQLNKYKLDPKWFNEKGETLWTNPLTMRTEVLRKEEGITVDHILPQKAFRDIKGFEKLPADVQRDLINHRDNLQPMARSANSSKGARVENGNEGFVMWNGREVRPEYRQEMLRVQEDMRVRVGDELERHGLR